MANTYAGPGHGACRIPGEPEKPNPASGRRTSTPSPPSTEQDLAGGLAMKPIEVAKHLALLEASGQAASRGADPPPQHVAGQRGFSDRRLSRVL
jgi:hypothetical protein